MPLAIDDGTTTITDDTDSYAEKVSDWEESQTTQPSDDMGSSPYRSGGATRAWKGVGDSVGDSRYGETIPGTTVTRSEARDTSETVLDAVPDADRHGETVPGTTVTEDEARDTTEDVFGTDDPTVTSDQPGGDIADAAPNLPSGPGLPDLEGELEFDTDVSVPGLGRGIAAAGVAIAAGIALLALGGD